MNLKINARELITESKIKLKDIWAGFDEIKSHNQRRVLEAFKKAGIQNSHYAWATGYGYDDLGKDKLGELYSEYFGTEEALVRPNLVSGTHAITCAILGQLNSGDTMLALGKPYDTLQTVFTQLANKYAINYQELSVLDFSSNDELEKTISQALELHKPKLVSIQRSRGYEWRDSYTIDKLATLIQTVRRLDPGLIIFVDNCYGEFTQKQEPSHLGADIIAGSLIKNPGAGIVNAGAYITGRKDYVEAASEILTAPGIGMHGGCMFDQTRLMFQAFYLAPLITSEALKGMTLAAEVFNALAWETIPASDSERNDVIQAVKLLSPEALIKFCAVVQANSPVNSMFTPIPADISGYNDQIIMASGSFIEGSSIELSCDGPLREPYIAYFQGGLSYAHTEIVLEALVEAFH